MIRLRQPFDGDYPITLGFGEEADGLYKAGEHKGIDYGCPSGTPILAAADGIVAVKSFEADGYGNYLIIRHDDGSGTVYAHLSAPLVNNGTAVKQGQRIGLSGNTGGSTGPHLHFEVRTQWDKQSTVYNPMAVMQSVITPEVQTEETPFIRKPVKAGKARIVCDGGANVRNSQLQVIDMLGKGKEVTVTEQTVYHYGLPYRVCLVPVYIAEYDSYGTQILENVDPAQ